MAGRVRGAQHHFSDRHRLGSATRRLAAALGLSEAPRASRAPRAPALGADSSPPPTGAS